MNFYCFLKTLYFSVVKSFIYVHANLKLSVKVL